MYTSRSDCHSPIVNSKKIKKRRCLTCAAATRRPELAFLLVFKTSALDVVGYCDCRHVCDDEESHHEDLDESDHVHEDNDDQCSTSGTEDCLVMFSHFHCTICLYSRCASVFTVSLPSPWLVGRPCVGLETNSELVPAGRKIEFESCK